MAASSPPFDDLRQVPHTARAAGTYHRAIGGDRALPQPQLPLVPAASTCVLPTAASQPYLIVSDLHSSTVESPNARRRRDTRSNIRFSARRMSVPLRPITSCDDRSAADIPCSLLSRDWLEMRPSSG